jgi:hypothetical protein
MKPLAIPLLSLVALAASSCGGTSSGPQATVNGTIGGQPIASADTIAATGTTTGQFGNVAYLSEFIGNVTGACALAQQHQNKANATGIELVIQTEGPEKQSPIGPGTYAITNGSPAGYAVTSRLTVTAAYLSFDGQCNNTIADTAAQAGIGTITIVAVSPSSVSGNFDLTFPNGEAVSGNFDSPVCTYNPLAPQPAAPVACQP